MARPVGSIGDTISEYFHKGYSELEKLAHKISAYVEKHSRQCFFWTSVGFFGYFSPISFVGSFLVAGMVQSVLNYRPATTLSLQTTVFSIIAATAATLIALSPAGAHASLEAHSVVWIFGTLTCLTAVDYSNPHIP